MKLPVTCINRSADTLQRISRPLQQHVLDLLEQYELLLFRNISISVNYMALIRKLN